MYLSFLCLTTDVWNWTTNHSHEALQIKYGMQLFMIHSIQLITYLPILGFNKHNKFKEYNKLHSWWSITNPCWFSSTEFLPITDKKDTFCNSYRTYHCSYTRRTWRPWQGAGPFTQLSVLYAQPIFHLFTVIQHCCDG